MKKNLNTHSLQVFAMTYKTIAAIALGVILVASCSQQEQSLEQLKAQRAELDQKIRKLEKESQSQKGVATPVGVTIVHTAPFHHVIDVRGVVDSRSSVDILPKAAGQISSLKISNGQAVSKGQLLAELDAEMIRKSIEEVKTQLAFANTMYEKQKRIYEQKAGSEIQYLQAKTTKESLEQRLASLDEQLVMYRIIAPTSGYVDNLIAKQGEMAMPGMRLFTIVNTSDMRVYTDLAEPHIATVKQGAPVTIVFPEINDTIQTKLTQVARLVNPLNRTFRVETTLPRVPALLRPNTTCNVMINDQTVPSTISVPISCVMKDNETQYVYVADGKGIVHKQHITTGLVSTTHVEVTSGLKSGDNVITRGMLDVAEGQTVKIIQ